MPDNIVDIVHRLTYEVEANELNDALREIRRQSDAMQGLQDKIRAAREERDKYRRGSAGWNIEQRRVDRLQKSYQKNVDTLSKMVTENKAIIRAYKEEQGVLGQLEKKLKDLKTAREAATSETDVRKYTGQIAEAEQKIKTLTNAGGRTTGLISRSLLGGAGLAAGLTLTLSALRRGGRIMRDFAKESVTASIALQSIFQTFEGLTTTIGATKIMDAIGQMSATTVFSADELAGNFQKLVSAGFGVDETIDTMQRLSDVAAAVGTQRMPQLIRAFERIGQEGGVTSRSLLRFVRTGWNPLHEIAEMTGKSMAEVTAEMKAGKIQYEDIRKALVHATSEGGRFNNMMGRQMNTLRGQRQRLSALVDTMREGFGSAVNPLLTEFTRLLGNAAERMAKWLGADASLQVRRQQVEFQALINALKDVNIEEDERSKIITELNNKYPELIGNTDLQGASEAQLNAILATGNEQFVARLKSIALTAEAQDKVNNLLRAEDERAKARITRQQALNNLLAKGFISQKDFDMATRGVISARIRQQIPQAAAAQARRSFSGADGFVPTPFTDREKALLDLARTQSVLENTEKSVKELNDEIKDLHKQIAGLEGDTKITTFEPLAKATTKEAEEATKETAKQLTWLQKIEREKQHALNSDAEILQLLRQQEVALKGNSKEMADIAEAAIAIRRLEIDVEFAEKMQAGALRYGDYETYAKLLQELLVKRNRLLTMKLKIEAEAKVHKIEGLDFGGGRSTPSDAPFWTNTDESLQALQVFVNEAMQLFGQLSNYRIAQLDREISYQQYAVEQATLLAERGNAEALKIEQDRLREIQREREIAARREAVINNAMTLSNAILAVARAAASGGGLFSLATVTATIAALAAGYAMVSSMNQPIGFKSGGYTGDGNINEVAGVTHGQEFVLNARATKGNLAFLEQWNKTGQMPLIPVVPKVDSDKDVWKRLEGIEAAIYNTRISAVNKLDGNGVTQLITKMVKQDKRRWN